MLHPMPRCDPEGHKVGHNSPSCGEETLARGIANLRILKHDRWDTLTNPSFCFSHHRCWPTYNTVMWLGVSGPLSISLLRVSLGNCLIKPQVQGLPSIHLVSGRLFYKVVSALLYCSTMFVLFLVGADFFFCICTVYTKEYCIVMILNS